MDWMQALPAIGSFLGGPAGGLVGSGVEWLASKLGASDKTVEGIKQTLSGMSSEQLVQIKQMDIDFQKFCLDNDIKLQLAQIDVNKEEVKNTSLLSQWRPAIGWICAFSLAYAAIIEPIIRFIATVLCGYKGLYPILDNTITMQILFGMLGLGAMRSYDKKQGTSS